MPYPAASTSTDWTSQIGKEAYPEYLATLNPRQQKRAKRKTNRTGSNFYFPGDEPQGAQPWTPNAAQTDPASTGAGALEANAGRGVRNTRGGSTGAQPASYQPAISAGELRAPAGSYASTIQDYQSNPEAMGMVADNPWLLYGGLAENKFGVPVGGRSAGIYAENLDPYYKAMGLLGDNIPMNNVDWISFGEQLFGGGQLGFGSQLNPTTMVQNIVGAIADETMNMAKGGSGPGDFNPLRSLAQLGPLEGMKSLVGILRGALTGTMPEQQLESWLAWLESVGAQFTQEYVSGDQSMLELEASGRNWLTALSENLGPSLGL